MKRIYYAAIHRPTPGYRPEIDVSSIFEEKSMVKEYLDRQNRRLENFNYAYSNKLLPYDLVRIVKVRIEEVKE